jgi:hypothetical protein
VSEYTSGELDHTPLLRNSAADKGANTSSSVRHIQRSAFVHRNVVGLVALDFVLRFIFAGVMHMSFVINVLDVDFDNLAAHVPASEFQVT